MGKTSKDLNRHDEGHCPKNEGNDQKGAGKEEVCTADCKG